MDQPKINFGDKLFLYGQFLQYVGEFNDYEYNSVMGYMAVGGYIVSPIETDIFAASMPGFVVDFWSEDSLTFETPFIIAGVIDVTDRLSLHLPLPLGTRVWMPTTGQA